MPEPVPELIDAMRLLVDLQQVSEVAQHFIGCLEPEAIAKRTTDSLIEKFDCAFARIWLIEPDQTVLRLVASSGLSTRTDGSFARVPMGAFKVGKIAQNRIPFLSNNLPEETWVKDRDWAIAHKITGFAGYPLAVGDRVTGVLAVFSHHSLSSEFLEVLQWLCSLLTVALENALYYQREKQSWDFKPSPSAVSPLSEQLASVLPHVRLSLVGTERSLSPSLTYVLLRAAESLKAMQSNQCRLIYGTQYVSLEARVFPPTLHPQELQNWSAHTFGDLVFAAACLGGAVQTYVGTDQKVIQLVITLPYVGIGRSSHVRIHCRSPILQMAFTHLAYLAGLMVHSMTDAQIPLLTDDVDQLASSDRVLWIAHDTLTAPAEAIGKIDLSTSPAQLREAVETIAKGIPWGIEPTAETETQGLSEREREILMLLAQGLRDRDIANSLHISERTVKFHLNNLLTKLKARTRCEAMYQSVVKGLIQS